MRELLFATPSQVGTEQAACFIREVDVSTKTALRAPDVAPINRQRSLDTQRAGSKIDVALFQGEQLPGAETSECLQCPGWRPPWLGTLGCREKRVPLLASHGLDPYSLLTSLRLRGELELAREAGGRIRWDEPVLCRFGEHHVQGREHETHGVARLLVQLVAEEFLDAQAREAPDRRHAEGRGKIPRVRLAVASHRPGLQVTAPRHHALKEASPCDVVRQFSTTKSVRAEPSGANRPPWSYSAAWTVRQVPALRSPLPEGGWPIGSASLPSFAFAM